MDLVIKSDPDSSSSARQCFNPAFVHAIAVPEADMLDKTDKICVVARGDGVVDVISTESEFRAAKSKGSINPIKVVSQSQMEVFHPQILKKKIKMKGRGCVWIIPLEAILLLYLVWHFRFSGRKEGT